MRMHTTKNSASHRITCVRRDFGIEKYIKSAVTPFKTCIVNKCGTTTKYYSNNNNNNDHKKLEYSKHVRIVTTLKGRIRTF